MATLSNLLGLDAAWKLVLHIEKAMKSRLIMNSVINPLTLLLGCRNGYLLESAEMRKITLPVCAEAARAYAMQAEEGEGSWNDREKGEDLLGVWSRPSGLPARARSIVWSAHDNDSDMAGSEGSMGKG